MMTRDEAFAQSFRLAWRYCPVIALIAVCLLLSGCGEPASTYDPHRGRFVNTEEYRRDQINREIDRRELRRERESGK